MIRQLEKQRGALLFITLIIAIFIFYMSSQTFISGGGTSYLSYVYHFGVFFALAFFLLPASLQGKFDKELFFVVIILCILYGISDELHQYFVPGRNADVHDVFIDSAGIFAAAVMYISSLVMRRKFSLQSKHFA
ncbi:MAG: VanZ family protein [Nanoarchaeota archaeon]